MKVLKREASNSLLRAELWTVQPDGIGDPLLVYVTTPTTPRPETGWPTVLATDGNMCAGTLAQAVGFMAMSSEMPAVVTVAVGYPSISSPDCTEMDPATSISRCSRLPAVTASSSIDVGGSPPVPAPYACMQYVRLLQVPGMHDGKVQG